jgi:hypothetical protein
MEAGKAAEPSIELKIMFLGCVIGRRGITIQLPPSSLAKKHYLKVYILSL